MESPTSSGNGTETAQTTRRLDGVHWQNRPGEPEDELKELLDTIRTRVYTLKTVVEEQSKEIEGTLDTTEHVVQNLNKED
jgi:hypothetical protein